MYACGTELAGIKNQLFMQTMILVQYFFLIVPGIVPRPPPVDNRDVTSFSAVVRWNPPTELNGVILSYTVNFVAVSMVNTPSGNMGRRRRQTNVVRAECILGGVTNIDRSITVEETSANLTNLSKCTYFIFILQAMYFISYVCASGVFHLLAADTVYIVLSFIF